MEPPPDQDIDAAIHKRLEELDWKAELFRRGQAVVAIDDQGNVRRYYPDGTSAITGAITGADTIDPS